MINYTLQQDPIENRVLLTEYVNQHKTRTVIVNANDEEKITKLFEIFDKKSSQEIVKFFEDNVQIKFGI